jgi:putative DNA-invertase from lambdoid prophage Rac
LQRAFFYINGGASADFPERELILLDKAGFTVAMNRVAVDDAERFVAAAERPVLNALLRRMAPGDLLVALDLASLGCSARDVLDTLMHCRADGLGVRCVEIGAADLAGRPEPQAVKTLRAIARMETATRSERSRTSLRLAQSAGTRMGRPASLSTRDRERVLHSLDKGLSVSEVARRFGTSRQTIMRIRSTASES